MTKEQILQDFERYLDERNCVRPEHRRYYVHWVDSFLTAACGWDEVSFESALERYLRVLEDAGTQDWQLRQASDAICLYRRQYRGVRDDTSRLADLTTLEFGNDLASLQKRFGDCMAVRRLAKRTMQTYQGWLSDFARYCQSVPEMKLENAVSPYLTMLATVRKVSASTQNQALNALLNFFRNVLGNQLTDLSGTVRAKRGKRLPVVLTEAEVTAVIEQIDPKYRLMLELLYGAGLRLFELLRLRVQDLDLEMKTLTVRAGKGDKDRVTVLPSSLIAPLRHHLAQVKELHDADLQQGLGSVSLPHALARKYPRAPWEWCWQYAFPMDSVSRDPESGTVRRHHVLDRTFQRNVKRAAKRAGIMKRVSCHTFRHSFATHLLLHGVDIREIQELLGHESVETTMIYTHVVRGLRDPVTSPLDRLATTSPTRR